MRSARPPSRPLTRLNRRPLRITQHCSLGGVISPLLLNVALHGLEAAAGVRYRQTGAHAGEARADSPILIRYADDFMVCCHSRQQAQDVQAQLAEWLTPRGLAFNEDKTAIKHLDEGVDFLGFTIRRFHGEKLLIRPSTKAVRRLRERLAAELRTLRGSNATAVIARLNPIIRGWAAYYRTVVSSKTFSTLDHYLWRLTYKWASHSHRNKPKKWIVKRYFGTFNKFRNDRWVFGDRDSGAYLDRFAWTDIVRHQLVRGAASPDDPDQADYWANRRRRVKPPLDNYTLRLLAKQDGHCPLCGDPLLTADQPPQSPYDWTRWWLHITRRAIKHDYLVHHGNPGTPDGIQTRLVHAACQRRRTTHQPNPPKRLA